MLCIVGISMTPISSPNDNCCFWSILGKTEKGMM